MMQTQIIEEIYKRINTQISNLQTEEATKHALVLPFLQAMGYDPFNPEEIVPEYTADFGVKSGEKVDYAIMKDGTPIILIECKKAGSTLDVLHASQLGRYFNVTPARIGILTNGVHYSFFSDLEQENRMDEHPFLQVDLSSQEGINNRNLRHFTKANFETDEAYEIAGNLKYIDVMQNFLENAYTDPPEEFVRMMAKQVYQGALTTQRREKFTHLTKVAFQGFVNNRVSSTLKKASDIASHMAEENADPEPEETTEEENQEPVEDKSIITTAEEIEGYEIVKALLSDVVDKDRITIRDTRTYCGILLDDTRRKAICRLYMNSETAKHIRIMNGERDERGQQQSIRYDIAQANDITNYEAELIEAVKQYLTKPEQQTTEQDPTPPYHHDG